VTEIRRLEDVPGYPAPHSPYAHAVVANGFVFVAAQIPVRPGGGPTEVVGATMQEQTRQALRNVQAILEAAGSDLDRVVKVTVLLARPDLYREMNEAYAEFFPGPRPARAMARFGAEIPGVLVAIEAIAVARAGRPGPGAARAPSRPARARAGAGGGRDRPPGAGAGPRERRPPGRRPRPGGGGRAPRRQ
jgi:2-iminobutanoate/2-iminopropanoate deaminase